MEWGVTVQDARAAWQEYELKANALLARHTPQMAYCCFAYEHLTKLQRHTPIRFKKQYSVPCSYISWGNPENPLVICIGGIVNTSIRFTPLAEALMGRFHVVSTDWVGRGQSGWLADERDYTMGTYVEQIRQLVRHLGRNKVIFVGSSLGGSVAMTYTARYPRQVQRLVLNDVGPFIPAARRKRRAQTLARHYVFRSPDELSRKVGAAQKNDGPVSEEVRLLNAYAQTVWSESEMGRIYRHDPRAMRTYEQEARKSLVLWHEWSRIHCPVLLLHGMISDALLPHTVKRMKQRSTVEVMHVPETGHTPSLSDPNQIWFIKEWLEDSGGLCREWSVINSGKCGKVEL